MIRLERSTVAGLEGESLLLAVHGALQSAIELEHATIPLYLYALFSLREGENREVAAILRSVVVEEMLHMVLLANVGNALGARPRLFTPSFVPRYPGRLPGGVEKQLTVRLRAFSLGQLRVFIDLEESRDPLSLRAGAVDDDPTTTIGEFYAAIAAAIAALGDGALADEPRRQVGPDLMGGAIVVRDVATALDALDTIVEKGEGTGTSPEEVDGPSGANDVAHFYRLCQIREGRTLVRAADATYAFAVAAIPFELNGVLALPDDPRARGYRTGSAGRRAMDAVNHTYTSMLARLDDLVNGHADAACFPRTLP